MKTAVIIIFLNPANDGAYLLFKRFAKILGLLSLNKIKVLDTPCFSGEYLYTLGSARQHEIADRIRAFNPDMVFVIYEDYRHQKQPLNDFLFQLHGAVAPVQIYLSEYSEKSTLSSDDRQKLIDAGIKFADADVLATNTLPIIQAVQS